MKTINRILATLALVSITSSMFAQTWDATENDTITVGSKAQYHVNLSIRANAIFNNSGVIWTLPGGGSFFQADGVTALPANAADGARTDTLIVFVPSATGTGLTLTAQEKSRPLAGVGCTAAGTTSRDIVSIALPTATFNADSGSCALPASLSLPINFTGNGNYDIRLNVQAKNMAGTNVGAAVNIDLTSLLNARTTHTAKKIYIPVSTATFVALPAAGGYYVVSMTNMQDRISKKTMGYAFNTTEVANATPAGVDVYNLYVYPAPTTQPIKHVRNY